MPTQNTYPGVYVEEVPGGTRTITGVATSITAFVGRTRRGPVNKATAVTSLADFERAFGGAAADTPVAYAVRDFFLSGGTLAVIVRLMTADAPVAAAARDDTAGITVIASSPGDWANGWKVTLKKAGDLFDLTLVKPSATEAGTFEAVETITALSVDPGSARYAPQTVAASSNHLTLTLKSGATLLAADTSLSLAGGSPNGALPDSGAAYIAGEADRKGIYALDDTDLFNLLCIPPDDPNTDTPPAVYQKALAYCEKRRAMLIVDPPAGWQVFATGRMADGFERDPRGERNKLGLDLPIARNAALFYPRVVQPDHTQGGRDAMFAPCGLIAGVFARTDATRGVWKAPAGIDASLQGIRRLAVNLTDRENGLLNPLGINCLRCFPAGGNVVWGSRTLRGDDGLADEYRYVPVRRLALFIEESLCRGTRWAVFEPNGAGLWRQLRLAVGSFMQDLFRQGAFAGRTPAEAYFVRCDSSTTPQSDIDSGKVNMDVGFAPLKPAEFIVLRLEQTAGRAVA